MLSTWSTMFTGVDRKAERDGYGLRMFVKLLKLKWFWFDLLSSSGEQKIMWHWQSLFFFDQVGVKSFHVEVGKGRGYFCQKRLRLTQPTWWFWLGFFGIPCENPKQKGIIYLLGGVGPQSTRFTQVAYRTPTKTFRWDGHAWYLGRSFGEQITSRWEKTSCQKKIPTKKETKKIQSIGLLRLEYSRDLHDTSSPLWNYDWNAVISRYYLVQKVAWLDQKHQWSLLYIAYPSLWTIDFATFFR